MIEDMRRQFKLAESTAFMEFVELRNSKESLFDPVFDEMTPEDIISGKMIPKDIIFNETVMIFIILDKMIMICIIMRE